MIDNDKNGITPGPEGRAHGQTLWHERKTARAASADGERGYIMLPDGTIERIVGYPENVTYADERLVGNAVESSPIEKQREQFRKNKTIYGTGHKSTPKATHCISHLGVSIKKKSHKKNRRKKHGFKNKNCPKPKKVTSNKTTQVVGRPFAGTNVGQAIIRASFQ